MHVDSSTTRRKGKSYTRYLIRQCYRENGKTKLRTVANISHCPIEEINAIRLALKHKHHLSKLSTEKIDFEIKQELSIGALWLIFKVAKQCGIVEALGDSRNGKLALWQIIARIIEQGSRLSAVRLARQHAVTDVLGLEKFDEDDLYENLDWLADKQAQIEEYLFRRLKKGHSKLFLYDVTSSYLEGQCNALAAYGYNRDGKKGKLQIVVGLLCNQDGIPISIEVFTGNTVDVKTIFARIQKAVERFGVKEVTFVGDRGMIKNASIEVLQQYGFHYITAITKAQINTLINQGLIQLGLFDESLYEIINEDGTRYVLRRNPLRAENMEYSRRDKLKVLKKLITLKNEYLKIHRRAKLEVALKAVRQKAEKLNIADWLVISSKGRMIEIIINEEELSKKSILDGCYVLKTDVDTNKEMVHARYKDLTLVERAFRTSKTVFLELRPIYVRLASRTRGHVFIVMLAYRIIKELTRYWQELDITVEEGIHSLSTLCMLKVQINEHVHYNQIPTPNELLQQLFEKANVKLPSKLPKRRSDKNKINTKKKLQIARKVV